MADVGLTVAEREGAFLTSKVELPESGVQVPVTLTVIFCELAFVAIRVVQDTVDPLKDLSRFSVMLQALQ